MNRRERSDDAYALNTTALAFAYHGAAVVVAPVERRA